MFNQRANERMLDRSRNELLVVQIEDETLARAACLQELAHVHRVHREAARLKRLFCLRSALWSDHVSVRRKIDEQWMSYIRWIEKVNKVGKQTLKFWEIEHTSRERSSCTRNVWPRSLALRRARAPSVGYAPARRPWRRAGTRWRAAEWSGRSRCPDGRSAGRATPLRWAQCPVARPPDPRARPGRETSTPACALSVSTRNHQSSPFDA